MSTQPQKPFSNLYAQLKSGEISRRQFIERSVGLGMATGIALMAADAAGQSATPEASPTASGEGVIPSVNTEGQTRGEGGEVKILQWQAPSQLNGLVATGDKDNLASGPVQESLMVRLADGVLAPQLITQVPSVANGDLAEDLTSVTFRLKEGVLWSDGEPLTANDVAFTIDWVLDEANASTVFSLFEPIDNYEVVDDVTITINYADPNPTWADAFTGMGSAVIVPRHILEGGDQTVTDESQLDDPRISLVEADLAGLPPITIINASIDPLLSDGTMLADAIEAAGGEVEQRTFDGVTHEFFGMAAVVEDAAAAQDYAVKRLNTDLGE